MRITTKAVYDWDGNLLEWEGYEYDGPVALAKRGQAKKAASDQMTLFNSLMQKNQGMQEGMLSPMTGFLQSMMTKPTGIDPAALAAMRSQAIQNASLAGRQGMTQAKSILAARGLGGGQVPYSGMSGQILGPTAMMPALERSRQLAGINIEDAQQALQNRWNAAQTLGGFASQFSPSPYVGGSSNALGNITQLATAPGLGSALMGGLGSGLGYGLGGWATGKLPK